jgi:pilus assembly protein CpaE
MAEKILIVDDDPETVNFIKLMLSRQGYETLSAMNGMQALQISHSEHPDIIILDVMMPGLDGFEVARSLRRHPATALTPILMFTAKTQVEDKLAGYNAGVDIYLTKPIHPVELQANIKALLTQKKTRTEAKSDKGYVTGVVAAKGGLGVSTIALNLAIAYAQKNSEKVVAAELKPGQGSWGQDLGITDPTALADLLQMNPSDITPSMISDKLYTTNYGVRLLLASNRSSDVQYITAVAQYESIIQELATQAPLVVLDIGTQFLPAFDIVTDLCDEIILITEPTPGSVNRSHLLADELRTKGYGSSRALTLVISNRTRADMTLSMSQIEEMMGQSVALGFPPATELAYQSAERCVPIIALQPEGVLAQQYDSLVEQIGQRAT